jgi:hypothetical protein
MISSAAPSPGNICPNNPGFMGAPSNFVRKMPNRFIEILEEGIE